MDTGTPQLCQGPIAESWPPQCAGAELRGWDWADQPAGSYERVGDVRWGEFTLTGGWDGGYGLLRRLRSTAGAGPAPVAAAREKTGWNTATKSDLAGGREGVAALDEADSRG